MPDFIFSFSMGLGSALFGALANILAKRVVAFSSTRDYISINFLVIFLLLVPFAPFFFSINLSIPSISLLILAASIDGLANFLYFRAFEISDTVTASSLLSISPLFTLLLLPILEPENSSLNYFTTIGIIVIIGGIYAINQEYPEKKSRGRTFGLLNISIPLFSSFLYGANIYLVKYLFLENMCNPFSYYFLRAAIISLLSWIILKPRPNWISWENIRLIGSRAVLVISKWLLLLYAVQIGNPVIIKAISDISPFFVVLIAFFFLRENISRTKWLGTIGIITGLFILTIKPGS